VLPAVLALTVALVLVPTLLTHKVTRAQAL
jgi:hypothetical protein